MEELNLLYATYPNADEAKAIARTLVGDRLASCANIPGPMTSIYRWDGEVA
jgi:periplasmic divalent cation tolerance protein